MKKTLFLLGGLAAATVCYAQSTVTVIGGSSISSPTNGSLTRMAPGGGNPYVDIGPGTGGSFLISNTFGTVNIGPQINSDWCHFTTSKNMFVFNKPLCSANGVLGSYFGTNLLFHTGMASPGTGGILRMTISNSTGHVGIGTATPNDRLDVNGGNIRINDNKLYFRGTTDVNHGIGYNAIGFTSVNGPVLFGWNGGLLGSYTGTAAAALRWDNSGNVTIGSATAATGSKLTVTGSSAGTDNMINVLDNTGATNFRVKANGYVYARDITVQVAAFPDYVFDTTYQLMPLRQLGTYVRTEHHLPGVPAAATVQQEGMSVGQMNVLLMEKVEELTLYVIDLQAQIDAMQPEQK